MQKFPFAVVYVCCCCGIAYAVIHACRRFDFSLFAIMFDSCAMEIQNKNNVVALITFVYFPILPRVLIL